MTREDSTRPGEVLAVMTTMANAQERVFAVVFSSSLFYTGERCADLRVVVALMDAISVVTTVVTTVVTENCMPTLTIFFLMLDA